MLSIWKLIPNAYVYYVGEEGGVWSLKKLKNDYVICGCSLIIKKSLTFEPTVQSSSVIPFWKPQNVSFMKRGGPWGPRGPPPGRAWR